MVVSALGPPPRTAPTRRWMPGSVSIGMVTVVVKEPEASVTTVPSSTGELRSTMSTGVDGGNPLPNTVAS